MKFDRRHFLGVLACGVATAQLRHAMSLRGIVTAAEPSLPGSLNELALRYEGDPETPFVYRDALGAIIGREVDLADPRVTLLAAPMSAASDARWDSGQRRLNDCDVVGRMGPLRCVSGNFLRWGIDELDAGPTFAGIFLGYCKPGGAEARVLMFIPQPLTELHADLNVVLPSPLISIGP